MATQREYEERMSRLLGAYSKSQADLRRQLMEEQRKREKQSRWQNIGSTLGTVIGAVGGGIAAGPMGALQGAGIGAGLGGATGSIAAGGDPGTAIPQMIGPSLMTMAAGQGFGQQQQPMYPGMVGGPPPTGMAPGSSIQTRLPPMRY